MSLQVIGAGLPRTATSSLRCALETLLGGTCYHMHEVFENTDHVPVWRRALAGHPPDWNGFLSGYTAIVDWPGSAFWEELSQANPDALVLLSVRVAPGTWWRSAKNSVFDGAYREQPPELVEWQQMFRTLLSTRLTPGWEDEKSANEAYERHNEQVRAAARAGRFRRFLEWKAADGWLPLCRELGRPVPERPFPHL
jgi:hypothetical protein